MRIEDWSEEQLTNLENNYVAKGLDEGGPFTLAQVRLEKLRRGKGDLDTSRVFWSICAQSASSEDSLTTYGDIWRELFPETPWKGNHSQTTIGKALGGVVYYCVTNKLPILTVLVVNGQNRELTPQAVTNIFEECKRLGMDVGMEPETFVYSQLDEAKALARKHCG